jgi:hypothetical protein
MDLTTTYLGVVLRNPLVASASPLSQTVDGVRLAARWLPYRRTGSHPPLRRPVDPR